MNDVQVDVLGPIRLLVDDSEVDLGGPRSRALVARLALDADHPFSASILIDDLWGAAFGDEFLVWENVAVNIAPTWRVPDLTVFGASAYTAAGLDVLSADVALLVEIVSPGSHTNDRITKPAEYAAAGIRAYWRVETGPTVCLTAYDLEDGASTYTALGTWGEGEVVELSLPVALRIPIADLTP